MNYWCAKLRSINVGYVVVQDYSQIYHKNIINLEQVPIYIQFGTSGPIWNPTRTMSMDS